MKDKMDDKIIWVGRHLGSKCMYDNDAVIPRVRVLDVNNISLLSKTSKLILKEIEDITKEDLKGLYDILDLDSEYSDLEFEVKEHRIRFTWLDKCDKLTRYYVSIDLMPYALVDFLRSKGYAIGIPKEYYITEKELKNEK